MIVKMKNMAQNRFFIEKYVIFIEIWGVFFASMNLTKLFYDENIMKSYHVAYFWKLQHIIKNMGKIVSLS